MHSLHKLVRDGDLRAVGARLGQDATDVDRRDLAGLTPLMVAAKSPRCSAALVRELLAHGASPHAQSEELPGIVTCVVAHALAGGDPEKVAALIEAGADIRYRSEHGFEAMLDAVHGRDVYRDPNLLALLELLLANGVSRTTVSRSQESAVRVLSHVGRFDAVALLLAAGADERSLGWTPLLRAVALGSLADVRATLAGNPPLEQRDWWDRTAWLLAITTGDLQKAEALRAAGTEIRARGRCEKPPLVHAAEIDHPEMLQWLIGLGLEVDETDQFGSSALFAAVERDHLPCVRVLLRAGAEIDRVCNGQTALHSARSREVATVLLEAGADPQRLSTEGRRALVGLPLDPDVYQIEAGPEDFQRARTRRFGTRNPEPIAEPFWESMIRAGVTGFEATQWFGAARSHGEGPTWCAQRFGQSLTLLPDSRIVQIAGEHEDYYDPDFCIYNDVFVHGTDGAIRIFGYPEELFPPTDFHTATLIGAYLYVIGSLGYLGRRRFGETQVFRLDTRDFRIERIATSGDEPGWIYRHRADRVGPASIRVQGGEIATEVDGAETKVANDRTFVLDTERCIWSAGPGSGPVPGGKSGTGSGVPTAIG